MEEFQRPQTRVQWLLGNSCNYHCSYCHPMFHMGDKPFPSDELVLEVCQDLIAHYDELGRDIVFEYIGGEPTLLESLPYVGERLHNHPIDMVLKTNGSASMEWWQRARRYLSKVVISVHREHCDLKHIYKVIEYLQEDTLTPIDLKVLVPVTHTDESWDWGVATLKDIRRRFHLGKLQMMYSNFGRGSNMYFPYSQKKWDQYISLGGKQPVPSVDDGLTRLPPSYTGKTCYAGIETIAIDSDGNIWRGWCNQGGKIGNIFEMPIFWPKEPIICKKDFCTNGFDHQARKD